LASVPRTSLLLEIITSPDPKQAAPRRNSRRFNPALISLYSFISNFTYQPTDTM
jgi:hypothetical protein